MGGQRDTRIVEMNDPLDYQLAVALLAACISMIVVAIVLMYGEGAK